jgi:glycosyltransferase involved in cell wall biosynthesis
MRPLDDSRVSVIIPCFNQAPFLADAIESAQNQTYSNVEILVVDDGSTDDTAALAGRFTRVRYLHQENQGVSAARNNGLRESTGAYIVFLDADDRLVPSAIEDTLDSFRINPECAFVSGMIRWINSEGVVMGVPDEIEVGSDAYSALLRRCYIFAPASVIFRRAPLEQVGGFDGSMTPCDDYDLYLRIASRFPAQHDARVVAEYRQHAHNMSSNQSRIQDRALAALRRQWPMVRSDPRLRESYMAGVNFWVTTYARYEKGSLLAASNWQLRGRGLDGLRGVGALAYRAPHWFLHHTARSVLHRAKRVVQQIRGDYAGVLPPSPTAPPPGHLRYGDLRRTQPIDPYFGFMRGKPVTLHYIQDFLSCHSEDIRGHVLEVMDSNYTARYGGDKVVQSDVVDIDTRNPLATIYADLSKDDDALPAATYDCVILTQTLQFIYDAPAALATIERILKPGGTALISVPGITRTDNSAPWYWSFTADSTQRLIDSAFPGADVTVMSRGNVLAATALLMGIASEELTAAELEVHDSHYPVCIMARVVKPLTRDHSTPDVRSPR